METITIDLTASLDANFFDEHNLIHLREIRILDKWVTACLENIASSDSKIKTDDTSSVIRNRSHDAITILGTRGSGKTSFLLSAINRLGSDQRVEILRIIDPTLIEEKGHIFLNLVSIIKEKVDRKLNQNACNPSKDQRISHKTWQELIAELSHGLPSMDGVGGGLTEKVWHDPEYIMDRGIRTVNAAIHLEENFNKIVSTALDILGKGAFLLCFDDIDIDFRKGWSVLETIRKYCTSPRLIVLISGDMELFSKTIRKQYWSNFGQPLLEQEAIHQKKAGKYNELVTEMEGQYLHKVLKPDKRIYLTTILQKLRTSFNERMFQNLRRDSFFITVKGANKDQRAITESYAELLNTFGIINFYEQEPYLSFLMSLPLRSQIRILKSLWDDSDLTTTAVTSVFISDLLDQQVNTQILSSTPKYLTSVILELLVRNRALAEAYQLQPITNNNSLNGSITALGFMLSLAIRQGEKFLLFDFALRIAFVRNLLGSLGYSDDDRGKSTSNSKPSIEGLIQHSNLYHDVVLKDSIGLIISYVRGYLEYTGNRRTIWAGTIALKGLAAAQKQHSDHQADRIDEVFKEQPLHKKVIGFLPLLICKSPSRQSTIPVYSFYNILAVVGELLKDESQSFVSVRMDDERSFFRYSRLNELSQIRVYVMPDFVRDAGLNSNSSENAAKDFFRDDLDEDGGNEVTRSIFHRLIPSWLDNFPNRAVAPYLLSKIMTRAFYAFGNIDENHTQTSRLGNVMQDYVIAFMNAVLIEDIRENYSDPQGLNLNNTNSSPLIFRNNLRYALNYETQRNRDRLQWSKWLLSCPILHGFLDSSGNEANDMFQMLSNFCKIGDKQRIELRDWSVFDLLQQVSLGGIENSKRIAGSNEFENLAVALRAEQAPVYLFQLKDGEKANQKNDIIRNRYKHLFKSLDSTYLRRFRQYLAARNISW